MADELGMPASSYSRYEAPGRFKKARLELGLARRVASILADRGVDADDVLALAGVGENETAPVLSSAQEEWLAFFDKLTSHQRKLLLQMARELVGPDPGDDPDPGATLHSPQHAFRPEDQHA